MRLNLVFAGLLFIAASASAAGWKSLLAARDGDLAAALAAALSIAIAFATIVILARFVSRIPRKPGRGREV